MISSSYKLKTELEKGRILVELRYSLQFHPTVRDLCTEDHSVWRAVADRTETAWSI